jgi:hypothetical protein
MATEETKSMQRMRQGLWEAQKCLEGNLRPSRERSLALTKLEECELWAERANRIQHSDTEGESPPIPRGVQG